MDTFDLFQCNLFVNVLYILKLYLCPNPCLAHFQSEVLLHDEFRSYIESAF